MDVPTYPQLKTKKLKKEDSGSLNCKYTIRQLLLTDKFAQYYILSPINYPVWELKFRICK